VEDRDAYHGDFILKVCGCGGRGRASLCESGGRSCMLNEEGSMTLSARSGQVFDSLAVGAVYGWKV
jgi:hypothetical protein